MTDIFSKKKRSWIMSRIRSTGTGIERIMEEQLIIRGIEFEKHAKNVVGKPDFVIRKNNIAVFCDSEWWHGHNWKQRKKKIGTRREFWIKKIDQNMKRDKNVNRSLRQEGWRVLRFWGFEIEKEPERCIGKIIEAMRSS